MAPFNLVFKFTVDATKVEEATALTNDICAKVQENEPGTLLYFIYKVDGKNEFVAVERYQDQAAFEKHLSQPYFTKFTEDIMPLIVEEQEMGQGATVAGFTR
ncbi:hypothetical protein AFLA_014149 [Aspergillus flavus NRRL3357]|nr:hypothetical protein AFLA_014149 [Aspergillus flavus NRRL3357]